MSKIAVVYWSGTGHTQTMAEAVADAAQAELFASSEFEPMFESCKSALDGKRIALFGSYGWGDGEWMRTWESDCKDAGAVLACESVICQDEPDDDALAACRALGEALK